MRTLRNVNMYVCMSRLGMLIRVTARAILSIVRGRSLVEGGHSWTPHLVLFVADRDRHLPGELSDPSRVQ